MQAVRLPDNLDGSPIYAAHVVAAAVTEGLASTGGVPELKLLMDGMLSLPSAMHGKKPGWGPLFVRNPGEVTCDFGCLRQPASERQMAELAPEPALAATR